MGTEARIQQMETEKLGYLMQESQKEQKIRKGEEEDSAEQIW